MIKYAFFDGDNVGNSIENLLNNKRVIEATHLSESIKYAIFEIEQFVGSLNDTELLIAGGDDVLIRYDSEQYSLDFLLKISDIFNKYTGLSMSCGVGENIEESINNLIIAKKQSKGSIKTKTAETDMQDQTVKKKTKLYIFTTSGIPDPYINVIAHCVAYEKHLNQIILIGIYEDRNKIGSTNTRLNELKEDIKKQQTNLSQKKYLTVYDKKPELIDIDLEPEHIEMYSKLKDINLDIQVIDYENMEGDISKILNSVDSFSYVFDVTALLKSHLVDLYNILRFKNISSIYSFELSNKPTHSQQDLIHNLTYKKTYKYTCLSESQYTKDKIIVSGISTISDESKYNKLMSAFQIIEKNRNNLEEKIANSFASQWLFIYFLIGISIITWVCWSIAQDGWNKINSLSFTIILIWYLLNYFFQSIFTDNSPSFDPRELFTVLKNLKKKKLEKYRSILDKNEIPSHVTADQESCDRVTERKVKVFISYADKDQELAEKLCNDLKHSGVTTWLRFRDLLPGQNYKETIRQAIKTSSFFLALFSSHSVSKKGIVHRELKIVKDLADELPLSEIFIIPIRLDKCDLNDEELEALRGVDLFQSYENGLNQILRVLSSYVNVEGEEDTGQNMGFS